MLLIPDYSQAVTTEPLQPIQEEGKQEEIASSQYIENEEENE